MRAFNTADPRAHGLLGKALGLRPVRMIIDPALVLGNFTASLPKRIPTGALVVDAGAGDCDQRSALRDVRYVGIDLTVGEQTADYSRLDAIADLRAMPIRSGSADAIVCLQVLEHLPDPKAVVAEFARVTKPGGYVFLSTVQTWFQHQKPHDYYRYTSFGLRWLFETNGFRVAELTPMGGYYVNLAVTLKGLAATLNKSGILGALLIPPRLLSLPFLRVLFPILAHFLDRLDSERDYTVGYVVAAQRVNRAA